MKTFADSKAHVFDFMNAVQDEMKAKQEEDAFKNRTDNKLRTLDKCQDDAKDVCLDTIFAQIYRNAVPLNDDFKVAHAEDIDATFKDFMAKKCPKGIEYYVKEGLKKNNPYAKKILEAVNDLVNDEYRDKAMNIEDYTVDDLPFKTTDDIVVKLDRINGELSGPEISQAIKDNVKNTAIAEITKAKQEKENLKNLEAELANDINMRTEESVNRAIELKGLNDAKDYVPSLFESVMINKMNKLTPIYNSGKLQNENIYNTLSEYGKVTEGAASIEDLAFIEAVEEYTCLSMLKALKLESFNKYEINDLKDAYVQERF